MRRSILWLVALLTAGCGKSAVPSVKPLSDEPRVHIVKPELRDISRKVGQPSFIDSYEQTAIYAKLPAYIEKWNVDIGDRLSPNKVMATLFIPELLQEHEQKKALVQQDQALVDQSNKLVEVARANLKAAASQVKQAQATVGQYEALVVRWKSEVNRLTGLVKDRVVDKQILDESERQLQANTASRDAATAAVETAEANQISAQASLDKAVVDVKVAEARLLVALADRDRLKALVGYMTLTAPYEGIVVARNANTGDFVLPATGDPSAAPRSADQSATRATPIYTVARTDLVRVYVDVPEGDAIHIVSRVDKNAGDKREVTKASVRVYALNDEELPAEVTRSSWALNFKSRTLRAEIDLKNPDAKLLPGMYAYGEVRIERTNIQTLPTETVTEVGNQFGCYVLEDGKAVWTQLQTGVSDGKWIEVYRKQVNGQWQNIDGKEQVISGDLSELSDGRKVRVEPGKPATPEK